MANKIRTQNACKSTRCTAFLTDIHHHQNLYISNIHPLRLHRSHHHLECSPHPKVGSGKLPPCFSTLLRKYNKIHSHICRKWRQYLNKESNKCMHRRNIIQNEWAYNQPINQTLLSLLKKEFYNHFRTLYQLLNSFLVSLSLPA